MEKKVFGPSHISVLQPVQTRGGENAGERTAFVERSELDGAEGSYVREMMVRHHGVWGGFSDDVSCVGIPPKPASFPPNFS